MGSTIVDVRDGLSSAAAIKGPCKVATTANITLSGHQTIDGVPVVTPNRVLVKDQTDARFNGLYIVDTGNWSRCKDFSRNDDVVKGTRVVVTDGTQASSYQVGFTGTLVIDTTEISFSNAPGFDLVGVPTGLVDTVFGTKTNTVQQMPMSLINPSKEFRVYEYIYALSPATAAAIDTFNFAGQNETLLLQAIRSAGDAALAFLQGGASRSAKIVLPSGGLSIKDEFFSDGFQAAWWSQTSLFKGKHLIIEGSGQGSTTLKISSNYVGSVRNTAHGNQRAYGPWSGQASPSILFGAIADARNGAPAQLSLRDFKIIGTGLSGKDPICWLVSNELDSMHQGVRVQNIRNHGQVVNGSYNGLYLNCHFENCGLQPTEGGKTMGYEPGFPPSYVVFDFTVSGSTVSVTAKAGAAYDGYAIGDAVPYFRTAHVGKTFYLFGLHVVGGTAQAGGATIASVGGDGSSTATMTLAAGVTGPASRTGANGSFDTVKFTSTAGSDTVTLSAPIKFGAGAADMLGHVVALVKAGSTGNAADGNRYQKPDVLVSRIKAVSSGDDTNGYSTLQLYEPARLTATDFLLTGQGFMSCWEETAIKLLGGAGFSLNDTDFINCRWEFSGGFGNSPYTGSCQFMCGDLTGTTQFVSCKAHGANPLPNSNFAQDTQFLFDNNMGGSWLGSTFTHACMTGKQVRLMGKRQVMRFTDVEVGSWQMPTSLIAFYLDPPSVSDWLDVRISAGVTAEVNQSFPTATRLLRGARAGINAYDMSRWLKDGSNTFYNPGFSWLDSTVDLNNVKLPGLYGWYADAPTNIPVFGNNSLLWVSADPLIGTVAQVVLDVDNRITWTRFCLSGTWSPWQTDAVRSATAAEIASKAHNMNVNNKRVGALVFDTTNNRLMVSSGATDVANWYVADGSASVTPA